jgi:hypothetical protein
MFIVSHSGKQHSYQIARALYRLKMLERFYTSSYLTASGLQNYFTRTDNRYWTRRFIEGLPGCKVDANWRFEVPEIVLRWLQGKSPAVQKAVYRRDERFDAYVARQLSRTKSAEASSDVFWGFQGSCRDSLIAARHAGMQTWCELATAHVVAARRILGEEAELHPEWAFSIDNLVFPASYEQRLMEEPLLADKVVVASQFTRETILEIGVEASNIIYLPLGCDIQHVPYEEKKEDNFSDRPLKLLYAGTVTQRKGIKYLLQAMKQLNPGTDVELHIIGGVQGGADEMNRYAEWFTYHAPVSQRELFNLYGDYDALVLPTIFEGFGLVIVEAMAAGLPVITTPHSIGPELIEDDVNGYIIPIRDVDALKNAIVQLRKKSTNDYLQMRREARTAALNYSWEAYELRLNRVIEQSLVGR